MKLVFKKSSVEFRPSYPEGTEIPVTADYSGEYGDGTGYYLDQDGKIVNIPGYVGTHAAVSKMVSVVGFSKIKLSSLYGGNSYAAALAFFANEEQTQGTNVYKYIGTSPGTAEVNIPEGALYIRLGGNQDAGGVLLNGRIQATLVV